MTGGMVGLMVLAIGLAVLVRTGPDGVSTVLGHPVFSVASGSMTPTFDTGDVIIDNPISATQAQRLHKGQIITFRAGPSAAVGGSLIITHRINSIVSRSTVPGGPTVYRTKGDANNAPDAFTVSSTSILGIYQGARIPFGGYVLSALHQPATFVILVLVALSMLAVAAVRPRRPALRPTQIAADETAATWRAPR